MACGACGRKKSGQTTPRSVQVTRSAPIVGARTPIVKKTSGIRAQPHRRCKKCNWPMNSTRKYDQADQGRQIQIWTCMNRKCGNREEA